MCFCLKVVSCYISNQPQQSSKNAQPAYGVNVLLYHQHSTMKLWPLNFNHFADFLNKACNKNNSIFLLFALPTSYARNSKEDNQIQVNSMLEFDQIFILGKGGG